MARRIFLLRRRRARQNGHNGKTTWLYIIAALGLVIYSNTFQVPFVFDDIDNIVINPAIKDFGYFLDPSIAENITGNIAIS